MSSGLCVHMHADVYTPPVCAYTTDIHTGEKRGERLLKTAPQTSNSNTKERELRANLGYRLDEEAKGLGMFTKRIIQLIEKGSQPCTGIVELDRCVLKTLCKFLHGVVGLPHSGCSWHESRNKPPLPQSCIQARAQA